MLKKKKYCTLQSIFYNTDLFFINDNYDQNKK